MADDPVVVSKSRPEKPGNRVKEKTVTTSAKQLGSGLVFGCEETDRVSLVVLRLVFQATTRRASRCLVLRGFSSLVPTELAQHLLSSVHRSVWPVVTACQTWCAGRKTPPAFPQLAKVINRDRSNPRLEHRAQGLTPAKPAFYGLKVRMSGGFVRTSTPNDHDRVGCA